MEPAPAEEDLQIGAELELLTVRLLGWTGCENVGALRIDDP